MVGVLFLALALVAQGAQGPTPGAPAGTPAGSRDAKATAVLRGRILSAESGKPLRRAQVSVRAPELPQGRSTSTNVDGVYVIRELPPGRYTVSVMRSGFLPTQYGQRRPGEPSRPLVVGEGQVLDRVDFVLQRAGVVSGRIVDEMGEPIAGVSVWPMQTQFFRGRRRLVPISSQGVTDDTGQYRLLGVPPGDYLLMATTFETWKTGGEKKEVLGYAPSFYPGVAGAGDAQRVRVGSGQQRTGIDFSVQPLRAATLSGTAVSSEGTPLAGVSISVSQEFAGPNFWSSMGFPGAKVAADGSWTIRDVAPGEYVLEIRESATATRDKPAETAFLPLIVQGVDLSGIALVTEPPGTLAGQVVTDDGGALPGNVRLRVSAQSALPDRRPSFSDGDNGVVASDGTFVLSGIVGPSIIGFESLPPGWAIRSIDVNGSEHVHTSLTIRGGRRFDGARIVLTKRFPAVSGVILDEKGQPADGAVVLFVTDSSTWLEAAGTARTVRPDQAGNYRFDAVRPGEYFIVALASVQQWQIADPEFLEELRAHARRVTLNEREMEVINLKVAEPSR